MAREEGWYGQARLGGCRPHSHHRRRSEGSGDFGAGDRAGALVGSQGKDRMEAPRMNRLRETAAPPSRPLLQSTGRAIQVAEGVRRVGVSSVSL